MKNVHKIHSPLPTPIPFGFHEGPTPPLICNEANWLNPSDILFAVVIVSRLESTQLGRWLGLSSNFGMYGSSILILPQRWMKSPIAPIQSRSTRITMKPSSGRMMILLPVKSQHKSLNTRKRKKKTFQSAEKFSRCPPLHPSKFSNLFLFSLLQIFF